MDLREYVQKKVSLLYSHKALSSHSCFNKVSMQRVRENQWTKIVSGWRPSREKSQLGSFWWWWWGNVFAK